MVEESGHNGHNHRDGDVQNERNRDEMQGAHPRRQVSRDEREVQDQVRLHGPQEDAEEEPMEKGTAHSGSEGERS